MLIFYFLLPFQGICSLCSLCSILPYCCAEYTWTHVWLVWLWQRCDTHSPWRGLKLWWSHPYVVSTFINIIMCLYRLQSIGISYMQSLLYSACLLLCSLYNWWTKIVCDPLVHMQIPPDRLHGSHNTVLMWLLQVGVPLRVLWGYSAATGCSSSCHSSIRVPS